MKKIIIILICSLSTIFLTIKVSAYDTEYGDVKTFFENNIDDMTSNYQSAHNQVWNASKVEEITDIYNTKDEKIGYLVIFDEGYIAYNNNMSVLDVSPVDYPYFYRTTLSFTKPKVVYDSGAFLINGEVVTNNVSTYDSTASNIYYPLQEYYLKDKFAINYSMVQIPYFKEVYDSSNWGNYMGISFSYIGENSGAVLATMGLMYTLKVNGGVDLTPYQTSYKDLRASLYVYTGFNYDINPLLSPQNLSLGMNDYLDQKFGDKYTFGLSGTISSTVPAVTLYYNYNISSADYCMRVGHAQEPDWWIFNTYYDIVMANENNFFYDDYIVPTIWHDFNLDPFYVVNQNYRNEMFQFFEGNTLLS